MYQLKIIYLFSQEDIIVTPWILHLIRKLNVTSGDYVKQGKQSNLCRTFHTDLSVLSQFSFFSELCGDIPLLIDIKTLNIVPLITFTSCLKRGSRAFWGALHCPPGIPKVTYHDSQLKNKYYFFPHLGV